MKITKTELETKIFPLVSPPANSLRRFEKYDRFMAVITLKGGPLNGKITSLKNVAIQTYSEGAGKGNMSIYIPTEQTEKDRWVFEWAEITE